MLDTDKQQAADKQEKRPEGVAPGQDSESSSCSSIEMVAASSQLMQEEEQQEQQEKQPAQDINKGFSSTGAHDESATDAKAATTGDTEGQSGHQSAKSTFIEPTLSELAARTSRQRSIIEDIGESLNAIQKGLQQGEDDEESLSSLSSSSSSSSSSTSASEYDMIEKNDYIGQRTSHGGMMDKLIKIIADLRQENEALSRALEDKNDYINQNKSHLHKYDKEIKEMEKKLHSLQLRCNTLNTEGLSLQTSGPASGNLYPSLGRLRMPSMEAGMEIGQRQKTTKPQMAIKSSCHHDMAAAAKGPVVRPQTMIQLQFDELPPVDQNMDAQANLNAAWSDLEQRVIQIGRGNHGLRHLQKKLRIFKNRSCLHSSEENKAKLEDLRAQIDRLILDRSAKQQLEITKGLHGEHRHRMRSHHHEFDHHHKHHHHRRGMGFHSGERPCPPPHHPHHHDHHDHHEKEHTGNDVHLDKRMQKRELRAAVKAAKRAAYYNTLIQKHQRYLQQAQSTYEKINLSTLPKDPLTPPFHGSALDGDRAHHHFSRRQKLRHIQKEILHDILATTNKAVVTGYKLASCGVNLALDKIQEIDMKHATPAVGASNLNQTMTAARHSPLIELIGQVSDLACQAMRPLVHQSTNPVGKQ